MIWRVLHDASTGCRSRYIARRLSRCREGVAHFLFCLVSLIIVQSFNNHGWKILNSNRYTLLVNSEVQSMWHWYYSLLKIWTPKKLYTHGIFSWKYEKSSYYEVICFCPDKSGFIWRSLLIFTRLSKMLPVCFSIKSWIDNSLSTIGPIVELGGLLSDWRLW